MRYDRLEIAFIACCASLALLQPDRAMRRDESGKNHILGQVTAALQLMTAAP